MRVIVAIKQVPDTDNVKMDPVTGTMIREGVEGIIKSFRDTFETGAYRGFPRG